MNSRPIYLDNQATTAVDPRVVDAMVPYFYEYYGNSGSTNHTYGWEAEAAITKSREAIANIINATPEEIIFTSGATESNNLVIKGIAEAYCTQGQHIITLQTEHNAILDPCKYLETLGFEVTYLPVESDGLVNLSLLEKAIRKDTILVSIMAANNEIGVLQPLLEIGEICHQKGVLCHTDGAQGIGKIPLNVITQNIDLMSLTAHKIHGPKGIGALYIRRKNPRVKMAPQLHGGGQERGWRSGTLATPSIVGFGKALEIAIEDRDLEYQIILEMRDYLWKQLSQIDGIYLNGHPTQRLASNLNISVEGVNGTALLLAIQPTVALSSGSACSSTKVAPSHVIKALGRNDKLAMATLRFGISRFNTMEEMDKVVRVVKEAITNLRQKV